MRLSRSRLFPPLVAGLLACSGHTSAPEAAPPVGPSPVALTPLEQLGRNVFFDANLSEPAGQACASGSAVVTVFPVQRSFHFLKRGIKPLNA